MMDKQTLREIAVRHAALSGKVYAQVPDFEPHEWVLRAMQELADAAFKALDDARQEGYEAGRESGYDDGYTAGWDGALDSREDQD